MPLYLPIVQPSNFAAALQCIDTGPFWIQGHHTVQSTHVCTTPQVVAMDACRSNLISNATQETVNRAAGHLDEIPQKILPFNSLTDLRACIKTQLLLHPLYIS